MTLFDREKLLPMYNLSVPLNGFCVGAAFIVFGSPLYWARRDENFEESIQVTRRFRLLEPKKNFLVTESLKFHVCSLDPLNNLTPNNKTSSWTLRHRSVRGTIWCLVHDSTRLSLLEFPPLFRTKSLYIPINLNSRE